MVACLLMAGFLTASAAKDDTVSVINGVRLQHCNASVSLLMDTRLSRAAAQVARGKTPRDAAQSAGYRAVQLAMIHVSGYESDAALRDLLKRKYCQVLGNPALRHVALAERGEERWILLGAARSEPGTALNAREVVLQLVNEARAAPRRCGRRQFTAAPPLKLDATLSKAAQRHADDMARHSYMDHQGRDGSTPAMRVTAAGYRWRTVGENVAAGAGNAAEVVAGWLDSPGHCANIMSPAFTEMGLAFAANERDDYGMYWAQMFAAPAASR